MGESCAVRDDARIPGFTAYHDSGGSSFLGGVKWPNLAHRGINSNPITEHDS